LPPSIRPELDSLRQRSIRASWSSIWRPGASSSWRLISFYPPPPVSKHSREAGAGLLCSLLRHWSRGIWRQLAQQAGRPSPRGVGNGVACPFGVQCVREDMRRIWGKRSRRPTVGSHMSYPSRGCGVGVSVGVEVEKQSPQKLGEPLLDKVGASNRGYCWSCSKDIPSARCQARLQVFVIHSRFWALVLRVLFFGTSWFIRTQILLDVIWIGSPLLRLTNSWVLRWFLGLHASS
jgi:hypothetical protein